MDDLIAFLRARYGEDEATAKAAILHGSGQWRAYGCIVEGKDIRIYDEGGHTDEHAAHIALHDPARALREVTVKRAIVERCECAINDHDAPYGDGTAALAESVLMDLGTEFSDHPDCRAAWSPEGA